MGKGAKGGTLCPNCLGPNFHIIEVRQRTGYKYRRRHCKDCALRVTTYEISEQDFELLNKVKAELAQEDDQLEPIKGSGESESSSDRCGFCDHWQNGKCYFLFPEAGGIFAEECSLYSRRVNSP